MSKVIVTNKQEVMETIFTHNIHKAITIKAIQNLSFKGNQSAWNIRNSGYTDPILEELYSNTILELCDSVNNGLCDIEIALDENGKEKATLVFADTDENDNSETFLKIYRSISNYLYSQRQKESKWLHIEEMDENGESTTYSINDKLALSTRSNMQTIEEMDVIKQVRNGLKKADSDILTDLLNGLSYREIATKHNITKKAVECSVNRIRKAYPKEEIKRINEVFTKYIDKTIHNYITIDETNFTSNVSANTYNRNITDIMPKVAYNPEPLPAGRIIEKEVYNNPNVTNKVIRKVSHFDYISYNEKCKLK